MPRNGAGTYSIPNTVVTGTTINSAVENANNADIAAELTNSVAKDGQTTMTGPLKAASGSVSAPGYTFGSSLTSGWYRIGADNLGLSIGGVKLLDASAAALALTGTLAVSGTLAAGASTLSSLALTTDLPITEGGTGASTATAAFDALAPTTTRGDLITRGAANNGRLAVGASGRILQSDGTDPAWVSSATAVGTSQPALVTAGGLQLLTSGNAAGATLDIVLTSYTGYRGILIVLANMVPVTDGVDLWGRLSSDGGANYDAGAGSYAYNGALNFTTTPAGYGSTSDTKIALNRNDTASQHVSNVAAEGGISLEVTLFNQTATGHRSSLIFRGTIATDGTGQGGIWGGSGTRLAAQDTDAVRFLFSSGDIASGKYAVYGLA